MENRAYALATGLFIILLGAALGFLGFWLSGSHRPQKPYVIVSKNSVNGLSAHSTVLYRGVAVGEVGSIRFDPNDFHKILVYVHIDASIPITQGTYAQLQPQGVTGLARVALNDDGKNPAPLKTSSTHPGRIPMHPSLLDRFTTAGQQLVQEGNQLIGNLNDLLGSHNQGRVTNILDHVDQAVQALTQLEKEMGPVAKNIPALTHDSRQLIQRTNRLVTKLDTLTDRASGAVVQARHMGTTGQAAMSQLNDKTLPRLNHMLDELARTAASINHLTQQLQNNPQGLLLGGEHRPPGPGEPGFHGGSR